MRAKIRTKKSRRWQSVKSNEEHFSCRVSFLFPRKRKKRKRNNNKRPWISLINANKTALSCFAFERRDNTKASLTKGRLKFTTFSLSTVINMDSRTFVLFFLSSFIKRIYVLHLQKQSQISIISQIPF